MMEPDDVQRLESEARALEEALAEFEHEARRVRDRLERRGGHGFVLEDQLNQLRQNIAVTKRDLERVRKALSGPDADDN